MAKLKETELFKSLDIDKIRSDYKEVSTNYRASIGKILIEKLYELIPVDSGENWVLSILLGNINRPRYVDLIIKTKIGKASVWGTLCLKKTGLFRPRYAYKLDNLLFYNKPVRARDYQFIFKVIYGNSYKYCSTWKAVLFWIGGEMYKERWQK